MEHEKTHTQNDDTAALVEWNQREQVPSGTVRTDVSTTNNEVAGNAESLLIIIIVITTMKSQVQTPS